MRILSADRIEYDEVTDVREVMEFHLSEDVCDELTQQLRDGEAELFGGQLVGWGRDRTLRDACGCYYHVEVE